MRNKSEPKDTPIKDAAGIALLAYIGVKTFRGLAAVVRDTVSFQNARKDPNFMK